MEQPKRPPLKLVGLKEDKRPPLNLVTDLSVEEKKNPIQSDLTSGTQTSKSGFEPSQNQTDTKTPSVLTPKGKSEYQEQVKDYKPQQIVQQENVKGSENIAPLMAGLQSTTSSFYKIPRYIYDVFAIPQNLVADLANIPELKANYDNVSKGALNPLSFLEYAGDYTKGKANEWEAKQRKYDADITTQLFKNKDFGGAALQIYDNVVASAPSIAAMFLTGGAASANKFGGVATKIATALPFASAQNQELVNNQNIPEWLKPVNAAFNGLSEILLEGKFGTTAILKGATKIAAEEGADVAAKSVKDFAYNYVKKALSKVQPVTDVVSNSMEEMATTLSQNIIAKATGEDPNRDIMAGVFDSGIVGGAQGAVATSIRKGIDVIADKKAKKKVEQLTKQREDISNDLDNDNLPSAVKEQLENKIETITEEINTTLEENRTKLEGLPIETKAEIADLSDRVETIKESLQDESISETSKSILEQDLKDAELELDAKLTMPQPTEITELETIKPQEDAAKTGKIEQSNITEREGITEQQQREQEDRKDQEKPITQGESQTSGGNIVVESREVEEQVVAKEKEVAKLEKEYDKLSKVLSVNLKENQQGMFENKPQSLFDDRAKQSKIVNDKKAELDKAKLELKDLKEKAEREADKVNQAEIEFANEEEYNLDRIEKENDPEELAALYYEQETPEPDYKIQGIMDYLGSKTRINLRDWDRWNDANNLTPQLRRRYIDSDNKSGALDQSAMELSDMLGVEVSEEDFINAILEFGSTKSYKEKGISKVQKAIADKYYELTGKNLTVGRAERAYLKIKNKPKTDKEIYELNESLQEIGITYEDIERYNEYAKQELEGVEKPIRKTESDTGTSIQLRKEGQGVQEEVSKKADERKTEEVKRPVEAPRVAERKGEVETAKQKLNEAKAKLSEFKNRFGIFKDTKEEARLNFEYHKALVGVAKAYIKEGIDNVKDFAKEIGEKVSDVIENAWKEANGGNELKLDDFVTIEPIKVSDDFERLAFKQIESDEFRNTLSNKERESGRELTAEEKRYEIQPLLDALKLGEDIVAKAKDEFGDSYVQKLLDYVRDNEKRLGVDKVSLILITLENDLNRQLLDDPNNLTLKKQEKLVQNIAIGYQRSAARAVGYGRLRQIARVGYDIERVTDQFFSTQQQKDKRAVENALQSDMDAINKEAELQEQEIDEIIIEEPKVKRTAKEVKADISEVIKKMRADLIKVARGGGGALSSIPYATQVKTVTPHIIELSKLFAELGAMKAKDIISAIREQIKDVAPDVKESDIRNVLKEQQLQKTPKDRLEKAKERVRERIAELQQQIADKRKELKIRGVSETDAELVALREQEKQLKEESNKYLTQESIDRINESKEKAIISRLEKELADLDEQIVKGEKERVEKKEPISTPEIERLKARRKAKIEVLNELDPNPKEFTKQALIDAGFGREITVTLKDGSKEKRQVLDWKKLAGEEGSLDNIRDKVEEALRNKGFSDAQISRMKDAFTTEINNLRADIAVKKLRELKRLNEPKQASERKSSARRLAELYDLGLFDQNSDEYDYLINKAIGLSDIGQEAFFEAKKFSKSLKELYTMNSNEFFTKQFIREINFKISKLLNKVAFQEGGKGFKFATVVAELMNLMLRTKLQTLKQYLDNQISGRQERLIQDIGNLLYKDISTKELDDLRKKYASVIKEDIVKNAGLYFGEVNTPFLTKSQIEDYLNSLSKDRLYHHLLSVALGKSYLEGADSLNKAASTERFFTSMALKVMTDKSNPNRVTREEALKILSEQLTGQKFSEALKESERIIKQINQSAGREILSETKENIFRGAMDLVKANLLVGEVVDAKMIEAAYNAAYKTAGYGLGHEANNIISEAVNRHQAFIEERLKKAIKDKEWGRATRLTVIATINRNIINPFVGGGTNWLVLGLQKSGLDVVSPLSYMISRIRNGIDLSTPEGVKKLEEQLIDDYRLKTISRRYLIGASAASLITIGLIASGGDDEFEEWFEKNKWAKKYQSVITPQLTLLVLAWRSGKLSDWFTETFAKSAKFEKLPKIKKAIEEYNKDTYPSQAKAWGIFGNVIGSSIEMPLLPVRFARDLGGVYRYIDDKPQERPDFLNVGFANGFFNYGALDYFGFRPDRTYMRNIEEYIPKSDEKTIKFLRSKDLDINADSDKPIIYKGFSTFMTEEQAQKYDKKYGETVYSLIKDRTDDLSKLSDNSFKLVMKFIKRKAKHEALKTIGAIDNRVSELERKDIKYILSPQLLKKRLQLIDSKVMSQRGSIRLRANKTAREEGISIKDAIMIEEQQAIDKAISDSGDIIYKDYKDSLMVKE